MSVNRPVLVIDFDSKSLAATSKMLEHEGYRVLTANSAGQADEHLESDPPAAVLVEPMLPGRDGFRLCRSLKRAGDDAPVVIIASKIFRGPRYKAMANEAGAEQYFERPQQDNEIVATLKRLVPPPDKTVQAANPTVVPTAPASLSDETAATPTKPAILAPLPAPVSEASETPQAEITDSAQAAPATQAEVAEDLWAHIQLLEVQVAEENAPTRPHVGAISIPSAQTPPAADSGPGNLQEAKVLDNPHSFPEEDAHAVPEEVRQTPSAQDGEQEASQSFELLSLESDSPDEAKISDSDQDALELLTAGTGLTGTVPHAEPQLIENAVDNFFTFSASITPGTRSTEECGPDGPLEPSSELPPELAELEVIDPSQEKGPAEALESPERTPEPVGETPANTPEALPIAVPENLVLFDENLPDGSFENAPTDGEISSLLENVFLEDESSKDRHDAPTSKEPEEEGPPAFGEADPEEIPETLRGMDAGTAELLSSLEQLEQAVPGLVHEEDSWDPTGGLTGELIAEVETSIPLSPPDPDENENSLEQVFDRVSLGYPPEDYGASADIDPGVFATPTPSISSSETQGSAKPIVAEKENSAGLPSGAMVLAFVASLLVIGAGGGYFLLGGGPSFFAESSRAQVHVERRLPSRYLTPPLATLGDETWGAPETSELPAEGFQHASRLTPARSIRATPETTPPPIPENTSPRLMAEGKPEIDPPGLMAPPDVQQVASAQPSPSQNMPITVEASKPFPRPAGTPVVEVTLPRNRPKPLVAGQHADPGAPRTLPEPATGGPHHQTGADLPILGPIPIVRISDLDDPPQLLDAPPPSRTPEAEIAEVSGRVFLNVLIGSDGQVRESRIMVEPGYGLGQAAREALRGWRYAPPTQGGKPVRVWKTEVVEFH